MDIVRESNAPSAVSWDSCCIVRFPMHVVNADNANDIPDLLKLISKNTNNFFPYITAFII